MWSASSVLHSFLVFIALVSVISNETYIHREYEDEKTFADWIRSDKKPETSGKLELKTLKLLSDPLKKSLYTAEPGKFYHYSLPLPKKVGNVGKDLVFQFALTHEDGIGCGGGYLKLLTENDPTNFDGDTPYAIMFGPDVCGSNGRIHLIFNIEGKNVLKTDDIPYSSDKLTHIYTLVVRSNKTYEVFVDCKSVDTGSIAEKWDFTLPKEIDDPNDKKPDDWVDDETIDDPDSKKPDDWDQPEFIPDPNATKPAEWDDETDGEFVPNKIPNPLFKGVWKPKQIPNPKYKGQWKPKKIPNPDYKEITNFVEYENIVAIGYDIWAVEAHSHLSHVVLSDDVNSVLEACKNLLPTFQSYNSKVKEIEKKEEEEREKKIQEEAKKASKEKKPSIETDELADEGDDYDDDKDDHSNEDSLKSEKSSSNHNGDEL